MSDDAAIAVIGVGCRFPDARDHAEFLRNIAEGRVAFRDLDRSALLAAGLTEETLDDPAYVTTAATLPGAEDFAAEFFGYSPTEAEATDPQQRIFLEVCWQALESAGHAPSGDPLITGVFAGGSAGTYLAALQAARMRTDGVLGAVDDVLLHLGGLGDFLPSRVAYKLGLRGPSVGVQTACSSSLTAVHYAVLSLLSGECDLALAGGAAVNEPVLGYRHHPGALASRDGRCRPFDARSTGTSFSSGVGAVVLRRLRDALADGDPVLAVVHGSAVGNDGSARSGFTAPSPAGLADVVAAALDVAGVRGDQLRYVEAHGSGTPLGDQIELRGLTEGLGVAPGVTGFCGLGSVKANIGHCGPAAGIAGLIKAVEVARTGVLPAQPLFERPRSPGVLADSPFRIPVEPERIAGDDRYVLVNSMGLGGTNATVVIGPPPPPVRPAAPAGDRVRLLLSARGDTELDRMAGELADALEHGAVAAADAAHTLRVGRTAFARRRVVCAAPVDLPAALRAPAPATPPARRGVRLVLPPAGLPEGVRERLAAAFRGRAEFVTDPEEGGPADDRYVIAAEALSAAATGPLGNATGNPAGDRLDDRLDEALGAAWLHGVDVDWQVPAAGRGRRVPLPTYPFTRRRYWALDRLPPLAAPLAAPDARPERRQRDDLTADLVDLWREIFGIPDLGPDRAFGELGGDSLTAMRIEAAVQRRHGVSVNVHRAGGGQATAGRMAQIVRGLRSPGTPQDPAAARPAQPADGREADPLDADLALPLGELAAADRTPGPGTLLSGDTGALETTLLHELLTRSAAPVHRLLPVPDEESGRALLAAAAARLGLPEPDPARVRIVPAEPSAVGKALRRHHDAEPAAGIGRVVHATTGTGPGLPYGEARLHRVLPFADILGWMREQAVPDCTLISPLAACAPALGAEAVIEESREQPLDPRRGGAAQAAWVAERLLERAERDGMRVRVFRTGLLLGAPGGSTGDALAHLLIGSAAVGRHPLDDQPLPLTPLPLAARAMAELLAAPGSVGRAYHLVDEEPLTVRALFARLAAAGLATEGVPVRRWQRAVALRALESDPDPRALDPLALRTLAASAPGAGRIQARAWGAWRDRQPDGELPVGDLLLHGLRRTAAHDPEIAALLAATLTEDRDD
ncbi:beta-ketoacyl synthase N-terminal-like domain-containing protein [Streptomyces sp. GS7]|uniref:beta-ketoacyl synthase N-terminal-like domain-containing protein n=1 Tax=Streptomyces sp. GS7 TaxID=2692234 RepID=UPI0013177BC9|nr:beta-ketoacyl synthase N-terminal-like domain-containing protein [Streptomyces sp. GS7]QHC22567.1 polyketide synthase type I [Streptomyces sp. GS7]